MLPRVFYKTIQLDKPFTRSNQTGNHWVGSTIKAWKVVGTNNENFKLRLVPDGNLGSVEGFELEDTPIHNLSHIANYAVFENDVAQAGVWVRVMFTVEDDLIYAENKKTGNASVTVSEGSNHSSSKVTVTAVTSEIISANDNRVKASLQHKSGGSVWVGNPLELADPDFKNICHEIKVGETLIWKNSGALNAKSDSEVIFSLIEEVV